MPVPDKHEEMAGYLLPAKYRDETTSESGLSSQANRSSGKLNNSGRSKLQRAWQNIHGLQTTTQDGEEFF